MQHERTLNQAKQQHLQPQAAGPKEVEYEDQLDKGIGPRINQHHVE